MNFRTDYIQAAPIARGFTEGLQAADAHRAAKTQREAMQRQKMLEEEERQRQQADALAQLRKAAAVKQAYRGALRKNDAGELELDREAFLESVSESISPQDAWQIQQQWQTQDFEGEKGRADLQKTRSETLKNIATGHKTVDDVSGARLTRTQDRLGRAKNQLYSIKSPAQYQMWLRAYADDPEVAQFAALLPGQYDRDAIRQIAMEDVGAKEQFSAEEAMRREHVKAAALIESQRVAKEDKAMEPARQAARAMEDVASKGRLLWGSVSDAISKSPQALRGEGLAPGLARKGAAALRMRGTGPTQAVQGQRKEMSTELTKMATGGTRPAEGMARRYLETLPDDTHPRDVAFQMLAQTIENAFRKKAAAERSGLLERMADYSEADLKNPNHPMVLELWNMEPATDLTASQEQELETTMIRVFGREDYERYRSGKAGGAAGDNVNALREKWGY